MSLFGDIPIVGNLLDGLLFGPDTSKLTGAMGDASKYYNEYAPEGYKARQQALTQASSLFGPVNSMLTQMYGPGAVLPQEQWQAAWGDPMPADVLNPPKQAGPDEAVSALFGPGAKIHAAEAGQGMLPPEGAIPGAGANAGAASKGLMPAPGVAPGMKPPNPFAPPKKGGR